MGSEMCIRDSRFEKELIEHFTSRHSGVLDDIVTTGQIADEAAFEQMIKDFADGFQTTDGSGPAPDASDPGSADSEIVDADDILPEEEIMADEA